MYDATCKVCGNGYCLTEKQLKAILSGYTLDNLCKTCFVKKLKKREFAVKSSLDKTESKYENIEKLCGIEASKRAMLLTSGEAATAYMKCRNKTCAALAVKTSDNSTEILNVVCGTMSYFTAECTVVANTIKNGFSGNIFVSLADLYYTLSGQFNSKIFFDTLGQVKQVCEKLNIDVITLSKVVKHCARKEMGVCSLQNKKIDSLTAYDLMIENSK